MALVRYETRGKVAVLTLDRPDRRNAWSFELEEDAWSFELEEELFDLADRVEDDDAVGAIVLTGSGTSFCPGMDMAALAALGQGPGWPSADGP
jgi:enoyl-CoA hydratase/carnithine racemase